MPPNTILQLSTMNFCTAKAMTMARECARLWSTMRAFKPIVLTLLILGVGSIGTEARAQAALAYEPVYGTYVLKTRPSPGESPGALDLARAALTQCAQDSLSLQPCELVFHLNQPGHGAVARCPSGAVHVQGRTLLSALKQLSILVQAKSDAARCDLLMGYEPTSSQAGIELLMPEAIYARYPGSTAPLR